MIPCDVSISGSEPLGMVSAARVKSLGPPLQAENIK